MVKAHGLVVAAATLLAAVAQAEVTTDRSSSLLLFPRIVAGGGTDTIIQLSNTSNNGRHAACFYVAGESTGSPPTLPVVRFDVSLVKQQPTHWSVASGRSVDPTDLPCAPGRTECYGAGLDPGTIPAVPVFSGSLICVELDASGFPVPGNTLRGRAIVQESDGSLGGYNAIGFVGFDTNNMDDILCLGGTTDPSCPAGAEYEACATEWILTHPSDGANDPIVGTGSTQQTVLTVASCGADLVARQPTPLTLQFVLTNEFEQSFTTSTTVSGWGDIPLGTVDPIFLRGNIGSDLIYTNIQAPSGSPPFVVVARTLVQAALDATPVATAINLHSIGSTTTAVLIRLPQPEEGR